MTKFLVSFGSEVYLVNMKYTLLKLALQFDMIKLGSIKDNYQDCRKTTIHNIFLCYLRAWDLYKLFLAFYPGIDILDHENV